MISTHIAPAIPWKLIVCDFQHLYVFIVPQSMVVNIKKNDHSQKS